MPQPKAVSREEFPLTSRRPAASALWECYNYMASGIPLICRQDGERKGHVCMESLQNKLSGDKGLEWQRSLP